MFPSPGSECEEEGNAETFIPCRRPVSPVKYWVRAAGKFPVVSEDDMLRKTINESSEPVEGRLGIGGRCTAKAPRISRFAAKSRCAHNWGGWGRLSEEGLGQHNPDRSEGPWGRAEDRSHGGAHKHIAPDTEQGISMEAESTKDEGKPAGKASSDIPALKPYRGKPAVRNFRGGDGNVGIIRSPVRAIALPDNRHEAEEEEAVQEGSSDPLGLESCAATVRDPAKRR